MTVRDPLFDTLFRGSPETPGPPPIASAAPVRESGTRSRAGNAMNRTRRALLAGAARAVEVSGTRITMAQVAAAAGVAKATLYNHFRTRDAVLGALVIAEVDSLVATTAQLALPDALAAAATQLSRHPVARALATVEPASLAALGCINPSAEGWQRARAAVDSALAAAGRGGTDLVLRWLASFVLSPASPAEIAADLSVLLTALPAARAAQAAQPGPALSASAVGPSGDRVAG